MNRIDCRSFEDRLERLMSGRSNPDERHAADGHLAACSRCRELYGLAREELGAFGAPPPPGMIESILERTSGSPCSRSRERLCDLVDGALETVDCQLVELHLEGCPDCSRLHTALVHLGQDLPAFAHLEPDAAFVSEVLVRTRAVVRGQLHLAKSAGDSERGRSVVILAVKKFINSTRVWFREIDRAKANRDDQRCPDEPPDLNDVGYRQLCHLRLSNFDIKSFWRDCIQVHIL